MGLYLTKPETAKLTQSGEVFDFAYASTALQGWQIQQDEFVIIKEKFDQDNCLFCIVEQYGGVEYGKYIQDHIVEALINDQEYKQKNYDKAIVGLYERLDNQLKNQFKESTSYQGVTLLLTLITNENIYVANAGLSRCVIRYDGKHKVMTVEHYPINDLEKQRILAAGGKCGRIDQMLICRIVEALEISNINPIPIQIRANNFLFLCQASSMLIRRTLSQF